jgi:hypothetical protein
VFNLGNQRIPYGFTFYQYSGQTINLQYYSFSYPRTIYYPSLMVTPTFDIPYREYSNGVEVTRSLHQGLVPPFTAPIYLEANEEYTFTIDWSKINLYEWGSYVPDIDSPRWQLTALTGECANCPSGNSEVVHLTVIVDGIETLTSTSYCYVCFFQLQRVFGLSSHGDGSSSLRL